MAEYKESSKIKKNYNTSYEVVSYLILSFIWFFSYTINIMKFDLLIFALILTGFIKTMFLINKKGSKDGKDKNEIINALEFWTDYHKKGYSPYDKLPVEHILLILNKIRRGDYN